VHLRTRNVADFSGWYPEIVQSLVTLAGHRVLDGEMCVLDDIGRPDFERLQERSRRRRWYAGCDPVAFMAFDTLTQLAIRRNCSCRLLSICRSFKHIPLDCCGAANTPCIRENPNYTVVMLQCSNCSAGPPKENLNAELQPLRQRQAS
jgi:hypothetical protein